MCGDEKVVSLINHGELILDLKKTKLRAMNVVSKGNLILSAKHCVCFCFIKDPYLKHMQYFVLDCHVNKVCFKKLNVGVEGCDGGQRVMSVVNCPLFFHYVDDQ
jgi:hypothetical protein